jgi:hypothetical protein
MPDHRPPTTDPEGAFLRYAGDPLAFVREVLGEVPWAAQQRVLLAVRDHPRTTVRSGHGVGKTWVAACTALWWVYSHRPSLVLSTAPTARQVESLLWAEINRLWKRAKLPLPGRCLHTKLEASLDQTGIGLTTTEPERFAGWHCRSLLVIVDEASGVPDRLFEVIQGTLTSAHCRLLLIGNPTRSSGCFWNSHHKGDWHRLKISAFDTPNFRVSDEQRATSDESESESDRTSSLVTRHSSLPCPWLVTPEWVEARRKEWGEDSDPFRVRVLGEFPRSSSDALIRLEWVEAAERRSDEQRVTSDEAATDSSLVTRHSSLPIVLGIDVARYGDCETVVALRRGCLVAAIWAWHGADLMHTCGRILELAREHAPARIVVDAVGMGAGLFDRLLEIQREGRELPGCELVAFQSGTPPWDPEKHYSRRDEAYMALRDRLRDGDIAMASHWSALVGQLCSLKYGFTSRGQLKIESKDDRRRRGEPSPDWADAVALAFAPMSGPFALPIAAGSLRPNPLPMPSLQGGAP